jgi:hypothetical protein
MNANISLADKQYFELSIGKRILKSEVFGSDGDIPVYSANVFEPFGYLKSSNVKDFAYNYILWGIDGNFEFNLIRRGVKFATTDHCGMIKILGDQIIPEYLLYQLEIQSKLLGYDRTLRPSLTVMAQVSVEIPLNEDGEFDLETQLKVVDKYMKLKSLKKKLNELLEEVDSMNAELPIIKPSLTLSVQDLFDLGETTNKSWFTSEFVNKNKGEIPVYSASKDPNYVSYGYIKDNLSNVKYFEDILTWNIDGSAARCFYRNGRFSISEKVIPLKLQKQWITSIDPEFVRFILEVKALEKGLSYINKAGKSRIKDIELEIPAKENNERKVVPDLERQKQAANLYTNIYKIKNRVTASLQELLEISIDI